MGSTKRPEKKLAINFILSQYGCLVGNVPGVTPDTVKAQLQFGNYYLFQSEVDKIIEEKKDEAGFSAEAFVAMLKHADAIKTGAAPSLTDRLTRIDSRERALEVANEPNNPTQVEEIQKIMQGMIKLRDRLNPLVNKNATCSIALKNKKSALKRKKIDKDASAPKE